MNTNTIISKCAAALGCFGSLALFFLLGGVVLACNPKAWRQRLSPGLRLRELQTS